MRRRCCSGPGHNCSCSSGLFPEGSALCPASDARFSRAQRRMKLSTSVIPRSPSYSPIRGRLPITLTLDEGTLNMMLGDEFTDDFYDVRWHRHGFDKVATGIGECLSFGRI